MSASRRPAWWGDDVLPHAHGGAGPPPGVDVWHLRLDADDDAVHRAADLLDPEERRRAGRIRDARAARRYVVAHGAVHAVLGGYLGVCGHEVRWSSGPHGKPAFDGAWRRWQWSLSRSDAHALLVVRVGAPVGVDVERIGDDTPARALAARFLPAEEAAQVAAQHDIRAARTVYHRLLSRKEACVKAGGGRLLDGLRLRVSTPGVVVGTGPTAGQAWALRDLPAPRGCVAALATADGAAGRLRYFAWGDGERSGAASGDAGILPGKLPHPPNAAP